MFFNCLENDRTPYIVENFYGNIDTHVPLPKIKGTNPLMTGYFFYLVLGSFYDHYISNW